MARDSRQDSNLGDIEMVGGMGTASASNLDNPSFAAKDRENETTTASRPLLRVDDDGNATEEEEEEEDDDDGVMFTKYSDRMDSKRLRAVQRYLVSRSVWATVGSAVTIITIVIIVIGVSVARPRVKGMPDQRQSAHLGPHWKGFSQIEYLFSYGDSWTATQFTPWKEQPSTKNPLGNPAWPGSTSSNAANYVGYLAAHYNHSFIKAHSFAFGGSTIDARYDHTMLGWLDLVHQVKDAFLPFYTKENTTLDGQHALPTTWRPDNSLFTAFFGINDAVVLNRTHPPYDLVFDSYADSIGKLYNVSARNFVIMNIPTMEQSPAFTTSTAAFQDGFADQLHELNVRIKSLAQRLRDTYDDITVFEVDFYRLFDRIIADPQSVPQTACYKDTTTSCDEWGGLEFGAVPTPEQIQNCDGLSVEEYLWINKMHVTWPVHDAMAAEIQRVLLSEGGD